MIQISANELASIMGGTLYGSAEMSVSTEFQFDSRAIKKGDVFLALKGESVDGHDFVDDAFNRGAVLAIATKQVNVPYIIVDDVLKAIGKFAAYVRDNLTGLIVIGITGSQGKTTTKDMVNSILANEGKTVAAKGSFNNDLGVPLTLLRCTDETKFCVVEMGA